MSLICSSVVSFCVKRGIDQFPESLSLSYTFTCSFPPSSCPYPLHTMDNVEWEVMVLLLLNVGCSVVKVVLNDDVG